MREAQQGSNRRNTAERPRETDGSWYGDQQARPRRAKERDISPSLGSSHLPKGQAEIGPKCRCVAGFPTFPDIVRCSTRHRGERRGAWEPLFPRESQGRPRARAPPSARNLVNAAPRRLSRRLIKAPVAQHLEGDRLALMLRSHPQEPHMRDEVAGVFRHGDHFPHCLRSSDGKEALPCSYAVIFFGARPPPPKAHDLHLYRRLRKIRAPGTQHRTANRPSPSM
jgi:hypothetical protein